MSTISKEEVAKVAELARLSLSDEELDQFTRQLNSIMTFAQKLQEVDTSQVEPTSNVLKLVNVLREDQPHTSLSIDEVLKNVAQHQDGQVKVPSVMEE